FYSSRPPRDLHSFPTRRSSDLETECPIAVSAPARFLVDLVVHTNSDIGSPRVTGSTNAVNAAASPGSVCASFFRPPPGARTLVRSEEHTSELQSRFDLVCRLLL